MKRKLLLACVSFLSLSFSASASPVYYTITDLGPAGRPEFSMPIAEAFGLNDYGTVVGATTTRRPHYSGYVFDHTSVRLLPALDDNPSVARAINNHGTIVGYSSLRRGASVGTLRRPVMITCPDPHILPSDCADRMITRDLGNFRGSTREPGYGEATGINSRGDIVGFQVGWVWVPPEAWGRGDHHYMYAVRAFLYQADKGVIDLGVLPGANGIASGAWAINDRTEVVGSSSSTVGESHAFVWDGSMMHDLGTLGGPISAAYGINNQSFIVGASTPDWRYNFTHAYMAVPTSGAAGSRRWLMQRLLAFSGPDFASEAHGISEDKRVVGTSEVEVVGRDGTVRVEWHATSWHQGGIYDLNDYTNIGPEWVLQDTWAINHRGQIVGTGKFRGEAHGFRLDPVP